MRVSIPLAVLPLLLFATGSAFAQQGRYAVSDDTPAASQGAEEVSLTSYDRLLQRVSSQEARPVSHVRRNSQCDGGSGCDVCCTCPCEPAGYYAMFENVFAKPFFTQSDAYVADDPDVGFGPMVADDATVSQPLDWGFDYTPRMEIGYLAPSNNVGWRTRYWHFDGGDRLFLDGSQDINATISIVDDPDIEIEDADLLEVVGTMELNVLDVEAMVRDGNTTFSGGLRWAKIDHNFFAAGDDFGNTQFDQFIKNDKTINVIGPTAAIERRVPLRIMGSNLTAFGIARASVLVGQFEQIVVGYNSLASLQAGLNGQPADEGAVRRYNQYLVGNGELQMGVEWTKVNDSGSQFFLRGTVEGQYWANGGSPFAYDNLGTDTDDYNDAFSDLGFLGFGLSVGYLR